MKRKLLKQIANEWQSNVWLGIELLIVGVVVWYIADTIYINTAIYCEPRGFDTEHCYLLGFDVLSDKSPDYTPYETKDRQNADLVTLVERLEARPEIEAVGLGQNAFPYNNSNSGTQLIIDSLTTSGYCVRRYVTPGFLKVFRYTGTRGETPEQLAEILEKEPDAIFVSDNLYRSKGIEHMDGYIGRNFYNSANRDSIRLAGVLNVVRYSDFSPQSHSYSMVMGMGKGEYMYCPELVVRVKENMDHDFADNIMKDSWKNLHVGNYYISSVKSFADIRDNFQRSSYNEIRNKIIGVAFLLVNIFLGLLGTFWYRTQQRVNEIAIRKVNGATDSNIFRRMIGEGELILITVLPLTIAIDYLLTHFELNAYYDGYFSIGRFIICVLISWGLMAGMIALGIAIPAYRAMKLQPAQALSEE